MGGVESLPGSSLPPPTAGCLPTPWFQVPRGYHFDLEEVGHPEVAPAMAMDVEQVDGAEDPEVQGGRPAPSCSQEAQAEQPMGHRLPLCLVPDLNRTSGTPSGW